MPDCVPSWRGPPPVRWNDEATRELRGLTVRTALAERLVGLLSPNGAAFWAKELAGVLEQFTGSAAGCIARVEFADPCVCVSVRTPAHVLAAATAAGLEAPATVSVELIASLTDDLVFRVDELWPGEIEERSRSGIWPRPGVTT